MNLYEMIAMGAGALSSLLVFFLSRQNNRVDRIEDSLNAVRIDVARQQQENKELHTHIQRIDKNLDDLFKKTEEVLIAVRKNGKD
jgi:hypothetical protein